MFRGPIQPNGTYLHIAKIREWETIARRVELDTEHERALWHAAPHIYGHLYTAKIDYRLSPNVPIRIALPVPITYAVSQAVNAIGHWDETPQGIG